MSTILRVYLEGLTKLGTLSTALYSNGWLKGHFYGHSCGLDALIVLWTTFGCTTP